MPSFTALEWWRRGEKDKEAMAEEEARAVEEPRTYKRTLHERLRMVIVNQTLLAQYFKLVVLFVIALVHVFYARDFLTVFREMELFLTVAISRSPDAEHASKTQFLINLLVDYKKNLWISVSAMCACLSASCFFLLLLREEAYKPKYVFIMRFVDFCVFMAMPALLYARLLLVRATLAHSDEGLMEAAKNAHPAALMNRLHCSIAARENVPLCSTIIERSVFPVILLEYLVALCLITAAYIGLAYLIVYCIKHWFPHVCHHHERNQEEEQPRTPCRCRASPPAYTVTRTRLGSSRPLVQHPYAPLGTEQYA